MNLPDINQLRNDQSTYITFTKSLFDFDKAVMEQKPYYFSKMVALNLPAWQEGSFFIDLTDVGIASTNPNIVIPKTIQYYMENILRQVIGSNEIDEITELAFWKTLNKLGLTTENIRERVTFINEVATSNFIQLENNNGWGEIVCQIPNKCKSLTPEWKIISDVANIVQAENDDTCLFDNGLKQFLFDTSFKQVLDFDNLIFSEEEQTTFDFNVLLLYYKDESGKDKLHGINFIYPFEQKITQWELETFTHKTNIVQTLGYQFKFNLKTCNNEASQIAVYELQENSHFNTFAETLGKLNSFLELKMREAETQIY